MNYYRITITGETEYSHEHMVGLFGQLIEEVEKDSNGTVGIASYTPIDENGDVLESEDPCSNCQEFDCYGCKYKKYKREEDGQDNT